MIAPRKLSRIFTLSDTATKIQTLSYIRAKELTYAVKVC